MTGLFDVDTVSTGPDGVPAVADPTAAYIPAVAVTSQVIVRKGLYARSLKRAVDLVAASVDIDVEYVDRLSFANDVKILALTPLAALGRRTGI